MAAPEIHHHACDSDPLGVAWMTAPSYLNQEEGRCKPLPGADAALPLKALVRERQLDTLILDKYFLSF